MLPARQVRTNEFIHWVVLLIAALLALALVSRVAGGEREVLEEPGLLPPVVEEGEPLDAPPSEMLEWRVDEPTSDLSRQLWQILKEHQSGRPEQAITLWQNVGLPYETAAWPHVAMAAAYLELGRWEMAAAELEPAGQFDNHNPIVRYYMALVRLEQAERAYEWQDAIGPSGTVRVSYRLPEVSPNTKSNYTLRAILELETALAEAPYLQLDQPLVPIYWSRDAAYGPTVRDLLKAIGAEDFQAKAHHALGALYLERSNLELAEQHMDQAARSGIHVLYGYRDLGEKYDDQGRHFDAVRAYAKSMKQGPDFAVPATRLLENLRKGFAQGG